MLRLHSSADTMPIDIHNISTIFSIYRPTAMEANKANQTHCYNPVAPAYPVWAYYAHGRQCRCQEDPVSLPSGRLEKTTRSSPHQHCPTGSETALPYAPRSSRFGSEPPYVEDDVDVWCYAILELHARNDDDRYLVDRGYFYGDRRIS